MPVSDYFIVSKKLNQRDVDIYSDESMLKQIANIDLSNYNIGPDFIIECISRNLLNMYKSFKDCFISVDKEDPQISSVLSTADLYPAITQKKVKLTTYVNNPNTKVYKMGLYDPLLITQETMACFASYFNNVSTYLQYDILCEYLDRIGVFFFSDNKVYFNTIGSILSLGYTAQTSVTTTDGIYVTEVRYKSTEHPSDWGVFAGDNVLKGQHNIIPNAGQINKFVNRYYGINSGFVTQVLRSIDIPGLSGDMNRFYVNNAARVVGNILDIPLSQFVDNLSSFNLLELNKVASTMKSNVTTTVSDASFDYKSGNADILKSGFYKSNFFLITLHAILRHLFGFGTEKVYIDDKLIIDNTVKKGESKNKVVTKEDGLNCDELYKIAKNLLMDAFVDGMYAQNDLRVNLNTYLCIFPHYQGYRYLSGSLKTKINADLLEGYGSAEILKFFYRSVIDDIFSDVNKTNKFLQGYYYGANAFAYLMKEAVKTTVVELPVIGDYFIKTYDYTSNLHVLSKKIFYLGIGLNIDYKLHFAEFLANIVLNKFYTQYNSYNTSFGYRTIRNIGAALASLMKGAKDTGTSPLSGYMWKISAYMNNFNPDVKSLSNTMSDMSSDHYALSQVLSDKLISLKYIDKRNEITYYPYSNRPNLANFVISIYNSNFIIQSVYNRSYYRLLRQLSTYKLQKAFWDTLTDKGKLLFKYLCPNAFGKKLLNNID